MRRLLAACLPLATIACTHEAPRRLLPAGDARLAVPGGHVWYKVTGTGRGIPVVLLHGGPGYSSFYLKAFEDLGNDRQVIRYDQLGGGKSDTTTDTTVMTIPHFVAELDSLRAALRIQRWHVLGHSWGTMLAIEYWRAHPDRVASLTFGSPVFDVPAYAAHARGLVATLSDSAQRAVRRVEAARKYDDPHYQNAMNEFYGRYLWRHPVAADLDSTMRTLNTTIYTYMQGPSEFTITGTFRDFNDTLYLQRIRVPTLLTAGEFDEVGPELVRHFATMIPGAQFELFPGSAHVTPWDARDANVRVVRAFLLHADSVSAAAPRQR